MSNIPKHTYRLNRILIYEGISSKIGRFVYFEIYYNNYIILHAHIAGTRYDTLRDMISNFHIYTEQAI